MPFKYEWKDTRGGGRRYTRTYSPEPVLTVKQTAPVEPVAETVDQITIEPTPKRTYTRRVVSDE